MIFNIMLVSNQSGNITPRLLTCARHVVTLAELNFFGSSSRQAEQESGIAKDKSSSARVRHNTDYTERAYRYRRTTASSSRHRPRHDLHRQGRTITSSSWFPSRRPTSTHRLTSRLRHLGWTGGFAISSSTYSRHFSVTS